MGYLLFESEEKGFQTVLEQFREKLERAGTRDDGTAKIQIKIDGKTEQVLEFDTKGVDELLEILKLNSD
ncbi:hypothetical protein ACC680_08835 [Rhizobium ruizarguesonis]